MRKSELERREIYVLTDLTTPAWRNAESSDIAAKLARDEDGKGSVGENVLLQLIDVSVPVAEIKNWSLSEFKLSQQTTTPGSQVTVSAELHSVLGSDKAQMTVELVAENVARSLQVSDGKVTIASPRFTDKQLIEVPDGGSVPFKFTLKELVEGTNHAQLKISPGFSWSHQ